MTLTTRIIFFYFSDNDMSLTCAADKKITESKFKNMKKKFLLRKIRKISRDGS